jgi:hypothetical protein
MQRRASQLTISYCPSWKQQNAWDVPLAGSDLTKAFPATSRNYLDIDETTEDVLDCTGEDLLIELLTGKFARLNIDCDFDPDVLAGMFAFAYGVAASPTGGTSEVQRETITGTGGTRTLTVQVGANAQTTAAIPFNAPAATIQTALNALSNVAPGDIVVTDTGTNTNEVQTETVGATGGTRTITVTNPVTGVSRTTAAIAFDADAATIQAALELLDNVDANDIVVSGTGPYVYTFSGANFQGANVAMLVLDTALLTGGSSAIVQTTPGVLGTRTYTFAQAFQKSDVDMISPNNTFLTGGTSTFAETTPGIGLTHAISRLVAYTLPLMTLYIGFRGSDKQPVIFKNIVVNTIRVRSASREKVSCSIELIGSAELDYAVGFTTPECQDIMPLRFGDCQMVIGGTDYIAANLGREFEYYFQNNVNPQFDGSGIYSTRHERADQRPSQFSMWVLGEPGDAIYELAKARTTLHTFIQCGPAGRHLKFDAPSAIVKLATSGIRFGGDPSESEMAIVARPKKVSGDATTPTHIEAVIGQTATLLTPA